MNDAAPQSAPLPDYKLTSVWPADGTVLNLEQALNAAGEQKLAEDIAASFHSLSMAEKMSNHPILAVTGQLNSGKSSVVASFLSPAGRARVPRGSSSATGTHRFVYWVPQSWLDQPDYKSLLLDLIATAHPHGVEFLDSDPKVAAEQYRSGRDKLETLSIPLLAGDPQLDALGAGLLDCPDIQTHDHTGTEVTESENPRMEFLTAAARVCSAFLVVWNRAAIRDRLIEIMLRKLRQRMASAPLYLLVNMIRPEDGQPALTLNDTDVTRLLEQFSIDQEQVYGAFDFAIEDRDKRKGWRHYTPKRLVKKFDQCESPQFYPLAEGVKTKADLHSLSKNLNIAEIQKTKIADHRHELDQHLSKAKIKISQWIKHAEAEINNTHQGLLDTCHRLMTDENTGEPLQIMSKEFAEALNESIIRTAPLAIKIPLNLAKPFDRAVKKTTNIINSLNLKKLFSDTGDKLEEKLQQHLKVGSIKLASSEALARRMQSQRWCPANISVEEIEKGWSETFVHFQKHPIDHFDSELLDETSEEYWQGFSFMQKFTIGGKAVIGTLGSLAAVCGIATLAVDGGAGMIAATSVSHAINGSIAAAVAAGGTAVSLTFQNTLLKDNTLPYLSRLFGIACDCFGLPRQVRDTPPEVKYKDSSGRVTTHKLSASPMLPNFEAVTPLTDQHLWDE